MAVSIYLPASSCRILCDESMVADNTITSAAPIGMPQTRPAMNGITAFKMLSMFQSGRAVIRAARPFPRRAGVRPRPPLSRARLRAGLQPGSDAEGEGGRGPLRTVCYLILLTRSEERR